ncbi:hypothetical protein [Peptoniphilus sp. HCN-40583]|uniref:hypothetical protein n=1 Tax=Peptoniphilus sp. HCN-40583 TaxID=3134662 RepID=UPI0030C640EF
MDKINPVELLRPLGKPVGYFVNPEPGIVPFIVYYGTGSRNFKADDVVYDKEAHWNIELYVRKKDVALEERLEDLLDAAEIVWEKGYDVYIDTEKVFMIPYYI